MIAPQPYILHGKRSNHPVSLIVCWKQSAGDVSNRVIGHLDQELKLENCGEIKLAKYFSISGVEVKDDIIQYPQSLFYKCRAKNILIFESDAPTHSRYEFINTIIDFAQDYCKLNEFVTIGEVVTASGPSEKKRISAVVNQSQLKKSLSNYEIDTEIDFQTPAGSVPTLSSYSLWIAQRRNLAAFNVWVDVPFYLASALDAPAAREILDFLNSKYKMNLDLSGIDSDADRLKSDLQKLMKQNPEINRLMGLLSKGVSLTRADGEMLAREVTDFLVGSN